MTTEIERAKIQAVNGMEFFLRNFAHVPEDRLRWTPTPTSKSALRIAAHTAVCAGRFADMIRDRRLPSPEILPEWLASREAEELAITTREETEACFRAGTARVLDALDTLSHEDFDLSLDAGHVGVTTMRHVAGLPGWHATLHAGQIDYLQTCWGDQEIYLG